MSRSPIVQVLSTIQKHRVRFLLMGGQACVLYGAPDRSYWTPLKRELFQWRQQRKRT